MIRRVTAHIWDLHKEVWRVHLLCKHVVICDKDDHSRKVKARFCPSCPGADIALMADQRNEIARKVLDRTSKEAAKAGVLKVAGELPNGWITGPKESA